MLQPFINHLPAGWPFSPLEDCLQKVVRDEKLRTTFWQLLLESKLFVLGTADDATGGEGHRTLTQGSQLRLVEIELESGSAVVAFTSLELLNLSITTQQPYMAINGRNLLEIIVQGNLALNPCGPYGKEITSFEIRNALGGMIVTANNEMIATKGVKILLGQLKDDPTDLLDSLCVVFRTDSAIQSALVAGVFFPDTGETQPEPLIGIATSDYTRAKGEIRPVLDAWASQHDRRVTVVAMDEKSDMTDYLRSSGRRFYFRKNWLRSLLNL